MLADCDRCALRDIACAQCVITALPDGQAGLGDEERRALRVLAAAGLVPPLRFRPAQAAPAQAATGQAATGQAATGQAATADGAAAQEGTAPGTQTLELTTAPACSTAPSAPVTGARPGPRRPAARRSAVRPGRQPMSSHR